MAPSFVVSDEDVARAFSYLGGFRTPWEVADYLARNSPVVRYSGPFKQDCFRVVWKAIRNHQSPVSGDFWFFRLGDGSVAVEGNVPIEPPEEPLGDGEVAISLITHLKPLAESEPTVPVPPPPPAPADVTPIAVTLPSF